MPLRLLADENIAGAIVSRLRQHGHDVLWVAADLPGAEDSDLIDRAQADGRIIMTFDKDFGELAFRKRLSAASGIILFRLQASDPGAAAQIVVDSLGAREDWAGHFAVVTEGRVRLVPLP